MKPDLEKLKALLEAATGGSWSYREHPKNPDSFIVEAPDRKSVV